MVTLLENLKLFPKINFQKNHKIGNLNFRAKNWWIIVIMMHWLLLEFEFWRQKLSFNSLQLLLILYLHKITIFGAKIQIINAALAFKNSQKPPLITSKIEIKTILTFSEYWIFGHNLRFTNSVWNKTAMSKKPNLPNWLVVQVELDLRKSRSNVYVYNCTLLCTQNICIILTFIQ